jgi:hypothetical protein
MIFFSVKAVQTWPSPWNRISILCGCLIPVFLLLASKISEWTRHWIPFKKKFLLPSVIIILGLLNIVFSEDQAVTLKVMILFIISGIAVFIVTSAILNSKFRRKTFLGICWASYVVLCIYGLVEFKVSKSILLLSNNPIPAGSLLILLSAGPIAIFRSRSNTIRILSILSICLGIFVIIMIGKRGPVLGLFAMASVFVLLLPWKSKLLIFLSAIFMIVIGYQMRDHLSPQLTKPIIKSGSTLLRTENYFFAYTIWAQNPVFGIGLHSPLYPYIDSYHPLIYRNERHQIFSSYVKENKTFENILLCGFVEMGTLFSIAYITLIAIIFKNMYGHVRKHPEKKLQAVLLLTPLFGFFVHSMTFDSILYPHLNWLAHSLLGLAANFGET